MALSDEVVGQRGFSTKGGSGEEYRFASYLHRTDMQDTVGSFQFQDNRKKSMKYPETKPSKFWFISENEIMVEDDHRMTPRKIEQDL
jgi:hypothetical protein